MKRFVILAVGLLAFTGCNEGQPANAKSSQEFIDALVSEIGKVAKPEVGPEGVHSGGGRSDFVNLLSSQMLTKATWPNVP